MWQSICSFNDKLAGGVTKVVGTMWCAYIFAIIALISLKDNLHDAKSFIAWFSSQFLQLVLLSIIMVGTQYLNKATDKRAQQDHEAIMAEMAQLKKIHAELRQELRRRDEAAAAANRLHREAAYADDSPE